MPGPIDDTWTLTDGAPWSSSIWTTIRNVRGGSPAPSVLAGAGRMVTTTPIENCRIIAAPSEIFGDVTIVVSVRTTVSDTVEIGFRVATNVDAGADPDGGYILSIKPTLGIVRFNKVNSYDFVAEAFDAVHHADGVWRNYRVHSRGNRHRARWWLSSDPEPTLWKMDVIDTAYTSGRLFIGTWNNDDNVTPSVVDFDNFHAEEILPPPAGIYAPDAVLEALYIGDAPVVTAYRGETEIVVP